MRRSRSRSRSRSRPLRKTANVVTSEQPSSKQNKIEGSSKGITAAADIKITVLEIAGLTCENASKKSLSTSQLESEFGDDTVISAVVSFSRNAFSSDTNIMTHIPSLPLLGMMHSGFQRRLSKTKINKYRASWPAQDPNRDEDDIKHSSFSFSRILKQEVDSASNTNAPVHRHLRSGSRSRSISRQPAFESELIDVIVGLVKGTEMITLGCATLVISAKSKESFITADFNVRNEAIKPNKQKWWDSNFSKSGSRKSSNTTKIKYASFPSDPGRRFGLAENATISVQIHVSLSHKELSNCSNQMKTYDRPPLEHINPILCDDSTISESTKSGYIVRVPKLDTSDVNSSFGIMNCFGGSVWDNNYPASQESPIAVNEFSNLQKRNSMNMKPDPIKVAKSTIFDFLCCLPATSDHGMNDYEWKPKPENSNSILMSSKKLSDTENLKVKNSSGNALDENELLIGTNSQPNIPSNNVIYFTPNAEPAHVSKQKDINNKDPTTDTVKSIERATQTLHHYADKFGVKVEELL